MKAIESDASRLVSGEQQLQVPLWQRHYSWEHQELEALWADLMRLRDHDLPSHFLGSVVLKAQPWSGLPSEAHRSWIVDGQQRVATLTLLLCAIRDRLALLADTEEERIDIVRSMTAQLLKNVSLRSEDQARLVLQERDRVFLEPIIEGQSDGSGSSLIDRAYVYFRSKLSAFDAAETQHMLSIILSRLSIVWITLQDEDNAHRVFQTLNAGGRQLLQSDLVRNYFFLLLGDQGNDFFKDHWRPMEADLGPKEIENYMVAWTITRGYSGSTASLFSYFRSDLSAHEDDAKAVKAYGKLFTGRSKLYRWIKNPADSRYGTETKQSLADLRSWGTLPVDGLLLWIATAHADGRMTESQMRESFEVILSFLARRQASGYQPNLHRPISRGVAKRMIAATHLDGADLVLYLKYLLSSGTELSTWPRDDELKTAARSVPIYTNARRHWVFGLLERANRSMFSMEKHAPSSLDQSKYSIEHVMPQKLTDEWASDLAAWGVDNPAQVHQEKVHVLGNLTLTPINSELGVMPFAKKRELMSDDWLRINQEIAKADSWTEARIAERSGVLSGAVCASFVPPLGPDELDSLRRRFGDADMIPIEIDDGIEDLEGVSE
jgi:hypothetical protein